MKSNSLQKRNKKVTVEIELFVCFLVQSNNLLLASLSVLEIDKLKKNILAVDGRCL